jgi:hypothetical protein
MEYLTLQDLPHRHYSTLGVRNMSSPLDRRDEMTGALPALAAVCEAQSCLPLPSQTPPPAYLPLPPTFLPFPPAPLPPLYFPDPPPRKRPRRDPPTPPEVAERPRRALLEIRPYAYHNPSRTLSIENICNHEDPQNDNISQNHHIRNSPPFQPGERPAQHSLPSFSQVTSQPAVDQKRELTRNQLLETVHREPSPPRTPSGRNASTENSPVRHAPHFDEIAWQGAQRRRLTETVGEPHRAAPERPPYDIRRPNIIDPALPSTFGSPRAALTSTIAAPVPNHHHRQSLPFPPPPPPNPAPVHARHQSSPVPQGHAYQQQRTMITAPPYASRPLQHTATYYPDVHQASHSHHPYDRASRDQYYAQVSYPPAPLQYHQDPYQHQHQPYSNNFTFQSTLGVDQNSFNRKRRGNLPKEATGILKAWFSAHRESPYPPEDEKLSLCQQTGLTLNQVCHPQSQCSAFV